MRQPVASGFVGFLGLSLVLASACGGSASPNADSCIPDSSPSCTEVDFELPGATMVVGTING